MLPRRARIPGLLAQLGGVLATVDLPGQYTDPNSILNITVVNPTVQPGEDTILTIDNPEGITINRIELKKNSLIHNDSSSDSLIAYIEPSRSLGMLVRSNELMEPKFKDGDSDHENITVNNVFTTPGHFVVDNPSQMNWWSTFISAVLYIEVTWGNTSVTGQSVSDLFLLYKEPTDQDEAKDILDKNSMYSRTGTVVNMLTPINPPAFQPSVSPTLVTTSSPENTIGPQSPTITQSQSQPLATSESEPARNGLSRDGIIGVAVGVSVGGILILSALVWFLCLRRRRRTPPRHGMSDYDSDGVAHVVLPDKEIPVLLTTSSRRSRYGGGGEGRQSTDREQLYAPYTDRSTATTPTPTPNLVPPGHHRRLDSAGPVVEDDDDHDDNDAAAAAAIAAQQPPRPGTSQTDLSSSWAREIPRTPTPLIAARYAHLIDENMSDAEIRRVEEEERQLDAAIENAGRGKAI
ncbi:hypothetical protein F4777DRAFT_256783 [Nemania sp. FL0916]|nr:hypothetical protein F4777DRAFT_256783 [Nemania sp. FL0916]